VLAQSSEVNSYTSSLRAGDILHALNRTPIDSVHQLQSLLQGMNSGQAVVVQIERAGKLQYIAFDWGD
jgi:S1-C subfamily serine protease